MEERQHGVTLGRVAGFLKQYMDAKGAGEISTAAILVNAGYDCGEGQFRLAGFPFQLGPEFWFQSNAGAVARNGKGALFQHA